MSTTALVQAAANNMAEETAALAKLFDETLLPAIEQQGKTLEAQLRLETELLKKIETLKAQIFTLEKSIETQTALHIKQAEAIAAQGTILWGEYQSWIKKRQEAATISDKLRHWQYHEFLSGKAHNAYTLLAAAKEQAHREKRDLSFYSALGHQIYQHLYPTDWHKKVVEMLNKTRPH